MSPPPLKFAPPDPDKERALRIANGQDPGLSLATDWTVIIALLIVLAMVVRQVV